MKPILLIRAVLVTVFGLAVFSTQADCVSTELDKWAMGKHRAEGHIARNDSRHPVETLKFFGLTPTMTVVEVSPGGGGWYTEILAPFLRDSGELHLGSYDPDATSDYAKRNYKKLGDKLAANPEIYDKVVVSVFDPAGNMNTVKPGTADMVLTFRNTHNWARNGLADEGLKAMYTFLKPAGILGVVQHRGNNGEVYDGESGYLSEAQVIEMAEAAGFVLLDKSEINANTKDSKDHPHGVWSLPPVLRLEGSDVKEEAMVSMGESDRMTLKFFKPVKVAEKK